jgi:hypothetical protein
MMMPLACHDSDDDERRPRGISELQSWPGLRLRGVTSVKRLGDYAEAVSSVKFKPSLARYTGMPASPRPYYTLPVAVAVAVAVASGTGRLQPTYPPWQSRLPRASRDCHGGLSAPPGPAAAQLDIGTISKSLSEPKSTQAAARARADQAG